MSLRLALGAVTLPAAVLVASVASPTASAYILERQKIALLVESTITDLDAGVAALVLGDGIASNFAYSSVYSDYGWVGTMTGAHDGHSVSVTYNGVLTPIPGPEDSYAISYFTLWNVDGQTSLSTGSATYVDLTGDTDRGVDVSANFNIDFGTSTVGGGLSVSYGITSLSVSAEKNLNSRVITAQVQAAVLDIPGVGAFADVTGTVNYSQTYGNYNSELTVQAGFGLYRRLLAWNVGTTATSTGGTGGGSGPGTGGTNNQTVHTPSPGTVAILLGAAPLTLARRRTAVERWYGCSRPTPRRAASLTTNDGRATFSLPLPEPIGLVGAPRRV